MKPHPACLRFRPPTCEGSSVRRPRWQAIGLLCLTTPVERYQVLQPRGVAGNPCGTTRRDSAGDRGIRNRLSDRPARSRRAVEAADATDNGSAGHEAFQVLRRVDDTAPAGSRESTLGHRLEALEVADLPAADDRWRPPADRRQAPSRRHAPRRAAPLPDQRGTPAPAAPGRGARSPAHTSVPSGCGTAGCSNAAGADDQHPRLGRFACAEQQAQVVRHPARLQQLTGGRSA
jgi:hypothetical protein